LYIDGRDDEMIVSGGENVFPAEVEELLSGHESINEAAAIGVDDEQFGQRLKAFVVVRHGAKLSEDDIKAYVKENLANYKVPREVVFLDELPRNPTGKVLKRELSEHPADGDAKPKKKSSKSRARGNGKKPSAKRNGNARSSQKSGPSKSAR
jgi:fatty-acyl-CoA synthase